MPFDTKLVTEPVTQKEFAFSGLGNCFLEEVWAAF